MNNERFWKVLFDREESTCFSNTPFGTKVSPVVDFSMAAPYNFIPTNFFSINPMKDSRKDSNVISLRNILIEMDTGTLEAQEKLFMESDMPLSTLVYSGGKSLHGIISLQTSIDTIANYKHLAKRVYDKLGGKTVVDTSVCNPSRFSRAPGAFRDGKEQKLLFCDIRIANDILYKWLGPDKEKPKTEYDHSKDRNKILSKWTTYFLAFGAEPGEWNSKLFMAVCDMTRAGYDKHRIIELCEGVTGILDSKDRATIESAYKTANND